MLRLVVAALAFGTAGAALAADDIPPPDVGLNLNIHLYGFSYHTDRQGIRRSGLDNEVNTGLGLNCTLREDERGISFVEAGFYRDSGSNMAKLAGVGYQFKYGEHWRLGGALVGVLSSTYNNGRFFVAPLPILTYDLGTVKLNAIYIPKYGDYNRFAVYGIYFSVSLRR